MKDVRLNRRFVALLALGAILTLGSFAPQAKAFTPLEIQYLPAVQLVGGQSAQVSVSNFSDAHVSVTITILNAVGDIVVTKTITAAASRTYAVAYANENITASYSAVVEVSAANSVASDFEVLSSNGEVATLSMPYINSTPATQNTPAVRLTPGQSGVASVTNITLSPVSIQYWVINSSGLVVILDSVTLNPGQTMTWSFTNTGTADNGYRAVLTTQAETTVTCSLVTLGADGRVVAEVQPIELL